MAEAERPVSLRIPWTTLLKVLAAIAIVWLWRELVWIVMVVLIALIITAGLAPVVAWLEKRRWPRWVAATLVVTALLAAMLGFMLITWSSIARESAELGQRLVLVEHDVLARAPKAIVAMLPRPDAAFQSIIAPYAMALGRGLLAFAAAFALAWILVLYLLIEADMTYRWVRGFVPARLRPRFDETAAQACRAAFGYIVANVVTSICAGVYVFVWLVLLHVPASLLLALLAFLFDFVPVLGFFLACGPAIAMASIVSPMLGLLMIPIYLAYHFVENYVISPRVYGSRLRLSNVAVLIAFAIGAELGGVAGALISLPVAAIYPAIERLWLREPFGDDVIKEHERLRVSRR